MSQSESRSLMTLNDESTIADLALLQQYRAGIRRWSGDLELVYGTGDHDRARHIMRELQRTIGDCATVIARLQRAVMSVDDPSRRSSRSIHELINRADMMRSKGESPADNVAWRLDT
jgi:hypothetical protein